LTQLIEYSLGDTTYLTNIIKDYEPFTINIFKNFCQDYFNVLDIGAHIGLSAIALASICKKGKVIAFEPVPATFNFLEKNIHRSGMTNIQKYNFALGNKESTSIMQGINAFLADLLLLIRIRPLVKRLKFKSLLKF